LIKQYLSVLTITVLAFSCSSDDDAINNPAVTPPPTEETGESIIRITEVNADTDEVTISNLGTAASDIGAYWLCLGPGTYVQISDATSR